MELKNHMEAIVLEKLDDVLKQYPECCSCAHCKNDIAIFALNNLPPKYVSTNTGEIFARIGKNRIETNVQVIEEITKAISVVSKNPRHES